MKAILDNSHILFDTNIVDYMTSKEPELRAKTEELVNALFEAGNTLYVSEFSHYELLRDVPESKRRNLTELLKLFRLIPHNFIRLSRAIKLYSNYKSVPQIKSFLHSISDVDIFIGALLFTDDQPYLLTSDYTDFPRPFFREIACHKVNFKTKTGQTRSLDYNFLSADLKRF